MCYRILVVEDHPLVRASTMSVLQASGHHQVKGAKDGERRCNCSLSNPMTW